MNQHSRQNAKNSFEKYFLKLLNNANFGYDCCNNLDNYKFIPIFDEVTYLKKFYNLFYPHISKFISSELLEKEIDENFDYEMIKIQYNELFCGIKITTLNNKRREDLEPLML